MQGAQEGRIGMTVNDTFVTQLWRRERYGDLASYGHTEITSLTPILHYKLLQS